MTKGAKCGESQQWQCLLRLSFPGRRCTSSIILSSVMKAPAASPIDVQHFVVSRLQFAGYGSWKTQWSHEHQRYCCYKFKESCVTKAGISRFLWFGIATHFAGLRFPAEVSVPESRLMPGDVHTQAAQGQGSVQHAVAFAEEPLQDYHARSSRDRARESRRAGAATSRNQSHRQGSRPRVSFARVSQCGKASYQQWSSCFEAARIPAPSSRLRLLGHLAS